MSVVVLLVLVQSSRFQVSLQVLLRVELLLKTDSGYPKDAGVTTPWQTLGIPFAITPLDRLHQSPPSPILGDRARGKRREFRPGAAARLSQSARAHRFREDVHLWAPRFREDGHLPCIEARKCAHFQRICTWLVAPRGQRLGERQRRTA